MPLHDHPGLAMLSWVLYRELKMTSFKVVAPGSQDNGGSGGNCDGNNWMDADCNDAHGNKDATLP
jgi:hypothetical protein